MALGTTLLVRITSNGGTTIHLTSAEAIVLRDWLLLEFPISPALRGDPPPKEAKKEKNR